MASGMNAEAVRYVDYYLLKVRDLQNLVESKLGEIMPALIQGGYSDEAEIEARLLQYSEVEAKVYFPAYRVVVNLNFA